MSNRPPKKLQDVTASAPSRFLLFSTFLGLLTIFSYVSLQSRSSGLFVQTPRQTLRVEVADTPEERRVGLSGRQLLAENKGMLFVFEEGGATCFWMKDTYISLDMIWMDENKQVVYIYEHATPESEKPICPNQRATFVLEVNGGSARQYGIEKGTSLKYKKSPLE